MTTNMTRIDKVDYYTKLPLSHLIKEADCAEAVLQSEGKISSEKLADSKIIIDELNKRLSGK